MQINVGSLDRIVRIVVGLVLLSLPLGLAVAHNAGAGALLAVLVYLNFRVRGG